VKFVVSAANYSGITFPFTLHSFRDLDANISEPAFKKMMERLIDGVANRTPLEKEEDLDSSITVKAMSKENIATLSKLLPHQIKIIEFIESQIDKGEKGVFPDEDRDQIIKWVQEGNADNIVMDDVSFICDLLILLDVRFITVD